MSYGVVRVQKFHAGSVKGIQIHDRREKDGISHTNKDIDWNRTQLNYDLHTAQNENFNKAVKERIEQLSLKRSVRKDAVVMAQILVTSDHVFFEGLMENEQRRFFEDSYEFLKERYGESNIVSSMVHLDETTPHMHFNFVPVTADGRLSAKAVLTKQSLIEQQDLFFEKVGKKYGLQRGERGGSKTHLETAEFKKQTAINKAIEVEKRASESVLEAQKVVEGMKDTLEVIKAEYGATKAFLDAFEEDIQERFTLPDLQPKEKGLLKKEKIVEISWQTWQALKENIERMSKDIVAHERANQRATDSLERDIKTLKKTNTGQYIDQLKKELYQAYTEKHEVEDIASELTRERDTLKKEKIALTEKYQQKIDCLQAKLDEWELFVELLPEDEAKNLLSEKNLLLRKEDLINFQNIDLVITPEQPEKKKEKNRGFSR